MGLKVGVGTSFLEDSYKVGIEAGEKAMSSIGNSKPDLVLLFSSIKYDLKKLLKGVRDSTMKAPLVGCTTGGEITSEGPQRGSIVVAVIKSEDAKITLSKVERISENLRKAGEDWASSLMKDIPSHDRGTVFAFPDGLSGNMTELVRGIYDVINPTLDLVGGGAGDEWKFERTYQFFNDRVLTDSIVGAYLNTNIYCGYGVRHGFTPIGEPLLVTRAKGNILYELNQRPALDSYLEFFGLSKDGKDLEKLGAMREVNFYPLGIPIWRDEFQIVHLNYMNLDGSIICANEIPENSIVRIMQAGKDDLLKATREAVNQAISMIEGKGIRACFIFDCISRPMLLEDRVGEEIKIVKEILGEGVPIAGFYTYGEIGRCSVAGGRPFFHTMTFVISVLAE
ncbi:MAG: FIST signal transduction protein [Candidatus Aminicenantia bacterium]